MKTLGVSFADFIDKESKPARLSKKTDLESVDLSGYESGIGDLPPPSIWKTLGLKTIFFVLITILLGRIGVLQLMKGSYYRGLSDDNRIVRRPLQSVRGVITDRTGRVLVRNEPYFLLKGIEKPLNQAEFRVAESTISGEQKENIKVKAIREYQDAPIFSHILGYISPINADELKKSKKLTAETKIKYNGYDFVGRTGIEEEYEMLLKGLDGSELVEISSSGTVLKLLGIDPPKPGNTIQTSIDSALQKFTFDKVMQMAQHEGAKSGVAIVQNTKTGEIITMVSYPSYDNNAFTHNERTNEVSDFFVDKKTPLLNRAISGLYAPGSTYKIVTALAGLESKTINPDSTYEDTGNLTLSGITFNNWYFTQYGKTEGNIDLKQALARSNDTFFYRLSIAMGVDKLVEQSYKFRLGQLVGVDIPGETKGLIPTPEWKKKITKEQWYPGNTINMSIGQGDVLTTPLQISTMTSAIANNGIITVPSIVNTVRNSENKIICKKDTETNKWEGEACKSFNEKSLSPGKLTGDLKFIKLIQEGMRRVTQKGGTAYPFFEFQIESAGKTGTAETVPDEKPHAWYTGYAPYTNPEITVTVLFEKGGEGSKVAAPVAKDIMEFYFKNNKK
jgi:penicillin-binding protein 2